MGEYERLKAYNEDVRYDNELAEKLGMSARRKEIDFNPLEVISSDMAKTLGSIFKMTPQQMKDYQLECAQKEEQERKRQRNIKEMREAQQGVFEAFSQLEQTLEKRRQQEQKAREQYEQWAREHPEEAERLRIEWEKMAREEREKAERQRIEREIKERLEQQNINQNRKG